MAEEVQEKPKQVYEDVESFEFGGKKYVAAPVDEPLEAYVSAIKKTFQLNDRFKTTKDGEPNPTYGKEVPQYCIDWRLAESAAEGQIYKSWITFGYDAKNDEFFLAVSDKSNMGKISKALFGNARAIKTMDPKDVLGTRLRITMETSKSNPERVVVNLDKLFPTKLADKKVDLTVQAEPATDIVLEDLPETLSDKQLDKVFK